MKAIVEIRNLSKRFGEKTVLDRINFQVNEGEVLGYLGPNGAGKTIFLCSQDLDEVQRIYELKEPDEERKWYFAISDQIAVSFQRNEVGKVIANRDIS